MSFSGCLRPDSAQLWRVCTVFFQNRVQLWRICTVFFWFSLSLPVEAVFKGVQFVHIMLGLDPKGDRWHLSALPTIAVCGGTAHMGEGGTPLFSYIFFPNSEKWLTPVIACIGEYTQAEAYLQEGLDLAFTGGLHPGMDGF